MAADPRTRRILLLTGWCRGDGSAAALRPRPTRMRLKRNTPTDAVWTDTISRSVARSPYEYHELMAARECIRATDLPVVPISPSLRTRFLWRGGGDLWFRRNRTSRRLELRKINYKWKKKYLPRGSIIISLARSTLIVLNRIDLRRKSFEAAASHQERFIRISVTVGRTICTAFKKQNRIVSLARFVRIPKRDRAHGGEQ